MLTNAPDLTPAETVIHYKALADIERGLLVLKSDIEIPPVHHRLPDRIRAHTLICFLALVLYRVMRMRLKAGEHNADLSSYSTRSSLPDPKTHRSYRRSHLQRHQQYNTGATRSLRCLEPPQTSQKIRCRHKKLNSRVNNINYLRNQLSNLGAKGLSASKNGEISTFSFGRYLSLKRNQIFILKSMQG